MTYDTYPGWFRDQMEPQERDNLALNAALGESADKKWGRPVHRAQPYVLGVSPGRRLERAAQALADGAIPDDAPGWVQVPRDVMDELAAALKEKGA